MQMDFPFREDYPPRNDIVFSIMFGDMELFSLLLKTVTGHTLNAKEIISQASVTPDNVEHNYIRFDTFAKDENGTIYSIDLQNTYSETLIKNRTIYYACRAISSQTVEKGCYEKLNKVVVSFIMTSKKNKLPVEVITMQNQEHENYPDDQEHRFIAVRQPSDKPEDYRQHNQGDAAGLDALFVLCVQFLCV